MSDSPMGSKVPSQRPKLFIVVYSLARGGAERVAVEMSRTWQALGADVTLVTLASSQLDFFQAPDGVERIALGLTSDHSSALRRMSLGLRRLILLRRLLRSRRPDATVGLMVTSAILLAVAGLGLPGRRLGSERTYPPMLPLGHVGELVRRVVYGFLDGVMGQTTDCTDWLDKHTFARRTRAIPNSVVTPLPIHQPVVTPPQDSPDSHILLAVGRFGPEKQFEDLVRAFAAIAGRHPSWRLAIAGGGGLHDQVARLASSLGLADRVILPGPVGNVADWYRRASAYVMASSFEGFPNSLLEAMASGLPVVAMDCMTGPADMIDHGRNGLLVPPQDFKGLEQVLDDLLGDADARDRLGRAALDVHVKFAEKRVIALWAEELGPQFVRLAEQASQVVPLAAATASELGALSSRPAEN